MLSGDASIGISITWSSASDARISSSIRSICASDDCLDIRMSMNTKISKPGILLYIMLLLNSGLSPYAYANAYACACITSEEWAYSTIYLDDIDTSLILFFIHFKDVIWPNTTSLWLCPPVSHPKHFLAMTMSMINASTIQISSGFSPKPSCCPKWKVSVNVSLRDG